MNEVTGDERITIHEDLSAILDVSSGWMYDDLLRQIGWGIIKFLVWLNDWIEGVATKIITLGGLYNSPDMKEFMEMMQPLAVAFFVVSITVVGFLFMLNKIEKRNEVVMNVLVAVGVIVILPNLMTVMEDILDASLEHVDAGGNLSKNILKKNIADVKYYVDSGFDYADGLDKETMAGDENTLPHPPHPETNKIGTTNYTFGNQLKYPDAIDVTEKLDIRADEGWFKWTTEDWVNNVKDIDGGYEFLTEKLVYTGSGGQKALKKLSKNSVPATNLGQQSYYRYHVNWAIAIATLAVTGFALVITVLKIGRSMFDLAFHQVYALFTASTDITGGQRLKKVLTEIVSTFAVVFVMMVLLKLFIIYAQWASDLEQNIGVVGVIILLIAGAWALIDAPDIVQRTLGIDAGLRSGWQQMMGAYAGMRMAGAGGKMIGKGARKLTSTVAKGVSGKGRIKSKRSDIANKKIPSRHAYHDSSNENDPE